MSVALSVGIVAVAATLTMAAIAVAGHDPGDAARAVFSGSLGSSFALLSGTLKRSTPLLFLGIAVAIAFRAGVLNIGADGQFLAGAALGTAAGLGFPTFPPVVVVGSMLVLGAAAGAAWSAVAAVLKSRFGVSEVVGTLLLNFVAIYLVGFLVRGPLQEPTGAYPQSATLAEGARLPLVFAGYRLHWGFVLALGVAVATWWVSRFTAAGFRGRAVGAGASAARTAGQIDVDRVQGRTLVASGALCGVAGAAEVAGVTYTLYEGLSPGYGYTAIAVALLGRLQAGGVVVAAILFGALGAGADAMQRDAGIPTEFAAILTALVVIGVLAVPAAARIAEYRLAAGVSRP